ncbi:uncharacterized protein SETTUDRAFT_91668 [Exserohilum turcica Et28A]|uniref:RTA1 like protein n=1 Tax=Exserohilum turcicum (strain 28A) TaxID=671987 RepID=R0IJF0_EXST2|nr:uncharacterized protein SETTUDRAFT_91668 [Exserohilum turcica Et28A]EOA85280.1 hypothetical protein SETTUDRAFT_91668 [Exserohilum turcica Et28A]
MSPTARAEDASTAVPKYILWPYTPSIVAGAIATAVMLTLFLIHTARLFRSKTWFCIPFVLGALFETTGYAARIAAHHNTTSLAPYILQSTLILLAPILFAASIYMVLGRLIQRTDSAGYALVRVTWLTKLFVGGDVVCFLIQGGGAGLLAGATTASGFQRGETLILGGLVLQIIVFGFFVAVAATWHCRLRARPTLRSGEVPWEVMMGLLYMASVCVILRKKFLCSLGTRVEQYGFEMLLLVTSVVLLCLVDLMA